MFHLDHHDALESKPTLVSSKFTQKLQRSLNISMTACPAEILQGAPESCEKAAFNAICWAQLAGLEHWQSKLQVQFYAQRLQWQTWRIFRWSIKIVFWQLNSNNWSIKQVVHCQKVPIIALRFKPNKWLMVEWIEHWTVLGFWVSPEFNSWLSISIFLII